MLGACSSWSWVFYAATAVSNARTNSRDGVFVGKRAQKKKRVSEANKV